MLRRQARLRREYLYNTVSERRQQENAAKRAKLEEHIATNKSIGSGFGKKAYKMQKEQKYEFEDSEYIIGLLAKIWKFSHSFVSFLFLYVC